MSTQDKTQLTNFMFKQILQIAEAMKRVNINLIINDQNALIYKEWNTLQRSHSIRLSLCRYIPASTKSVFYNICQRENKNAYTETFFIILKTLKL